MTFFLHSKVSGTTSRKLYCGKAGHDPRRDGYVVPATDIKRDNFGVLDGRIVAVDYGS